MTVDKLAVAASGASSSASLSSSSSCGPNKEAALRKEFEQNYRNYIDNVYLFTRINDILLGSEMSAKPLDLGAPSVVDLKKLRQQFFRSINATLGTSTTAMCPASTNLNVDSNSASVSAVANNVSNRLNEEVKNYLREKIGEILDKELTEINEIFDYDKPDEEFATNKSDEFDLVPVKLRILIDTVAQLETAGQRAKSDYDLKLNHCLKLAVDIINLMRDMLSKFKLGFYANKNSVECEHDLLELELLLVKIELIIDELSFDLYGKAEKVHALTTIRSHLDAEYERIRDACVHAKSELNAFKALGEEFERLVVKYSNLKRDLAFKKAHLKTLKDDL